MILAIPLDENEKDVCPSFGRCPLHLFYDTETKQAEIAVNPAAEAQGGAGLKAAQAVADHRVDVLITPRCGENASKVLKAAGIAIYKTSGSDAMENIRLYLEGSLEELTHFHAGYHGIQ